MTFAVVACVTKASQGSDKDFFFTHVMHCSRLQLWVGYFIYLNFHALVQ